MFYILGVIDTTYWGCYTGDGHNYTGQANYGNNGRECQRWDDTYHYYLIARDDNMERNEPAVYNWMEIEAEYQYDIEGNEIIHNFCR